MALKLGRDVLDIIERIAAAAAAERQRRPGKPVIGRIQSRMLAGEI